MWWNSMSTLQQVMFVIACAGSAVLVIQIVLMLIGGASDGADLDVDVDVGGGGVSDAFDAADADGVLDGDVGDGAIGGDSIQAEGGGAVMPFGLRLLSLRSLLAFIVVGAWVCYTVCYALDWYWAVIIALACGFAAACGMAAAMIGMEKLQDNGNIDPSNAIGKTGSVYLTVPPTRSGRGKVNVLIQERYCEYDAVTDDDEPLPTGSQIQVSGCAADGVLVVKRYKKPAITIETE